MMIALICGFVQASPVQMVIKKDIPFMTAYGQTYKLDMYGDRNAVGKQQPLAIIVHGGGFQGGDKANNKVMYKAKLFAERGFRAVSINYPLCKDMFDHTTGLLHPWDAEQPTNGDNSRCKGVAVGTDDLPPEVRDTLPEPAARAVRLAIKFMHELAIPLDIDTTKTVCSGGSAGAITCYASLFFNTTRINHPNITNALVPDPDLDRYKINVAAGHAGGFPTEMNVTQDSIDLAPGAAVWDLHGDEDHVVPLAWSDRLMEIADQFGLPHGQVVVEGAGHSMTEYLQGDILEGMFDFIFENLGVTQTSSRSDSDSASASYSFDSSTSSSSSPSSSAAITVFAVILGLWQFEAV